MILGHGIPIMIWNSLVFTGGFDGLAPVRQALDSISGLVSGCSSGDQELHIHVTPIHSVDNDHLYWLFINALMWLHKHNSLLSLWHCEDLNSNTSKISEILFIVYYWNGKITASFKLISLLCQRQNGYIVEVSESEARWHTGSSKLDHWYSQTVSVEHHHRNSSLLNFINLNSGCPPPVSNWLV
jgi:hypothetical protein